MLPLKPELLHPCRRCFSHHCGDSSFLSCKSKVATEPHGLHMSTPCFIGSWLHIQLASEHPCLLSSGRYYSSDTRGGAGQGTICTLLGMYAVIKWKHKISPASLSTHAIHPGQVKDELIIWCEFTWVMQGKALGESKPQGICSHISSHPAAPSQTFRRGWWWPMGCFSGQADVQHEQDQWGCRFLCLSVSCDQL